MTKFSVLFRKITLILLALCTVPAQAFNLNEAVIDKALSAPVQKLWPNAVAFVVAGGLVNGLFLERHNPSGFSTCCALGIFWASITLALLKGAHSYSGTVYAKIIAVTIVPLLCIACTRHNRGEALISSCISTIVAVAAANRVT